ncbi:CHAT domain-containing protein [Nocardia thailandica]
MSRSPAVPPTALIRLADAGDVYVAWRWLDAAAAPGVAVLPGEDVDRVVARLAAELPRPGDPAGLGRALTTGVLADPDAENAFAQELSRVLLPYALAVQLHDFHQRGIVPHLRIQPSPRLAQVPWELLAPDPDIRLLDLADLSLLAPASVVRAPDRAVRRWAETRDRPVVAVLDPRVPGFRADSELGSVLGRTTPESPIARHFSAYGARITPAGGLFRRTDTDRDWLAATLAAGAARLFYLGHVTAAAPGSGESEHAALHLTCGPDTRGFAALTRTHRPLTAKDLLLGTHTLDEHPVAGRDRYPMPSRVALVACESGGDQRFTEALGLTTAALANGAELVTATRWPLPTDHAFHTLAGVPEDRFPLQEAVCAIDAAHDAVDPIGELAAWQRARLAAWRTRPTAADAPVLWAAPVTVRD